MEPEASRNPQKQNKNIKAKVADICFAVAGESHVKIKDNITHRLGRFNDQQRRPRTTIIRFSNRTSHDLVWRMAKNCTFLKENKLKFTEDLTTADKALREKLWLLIDAANKEGKKAHFAGVRMIIEGKEIRLHTRRSLRLSRWTPP